MHQNRLAAIDLGSNSIHLVVVECFDNLQFRILETEKRTLRLAASLGREKIFSEETLRMIESAFVQMGGIAKTYGAKLRAVATFATREAGNHHELCERLWVKHRIDLEVIDGSEEARLEFLGVQYGLGMQTGQRFFLVDIGGGSTELSVGKQSERQCELSYSLSLGAVALTSRYFKNQFSRKNCEKLSEHLESQLLLPLKVLKKVLPPVAVMSSGTAKALAHMTATIRGETSRTDWNNYIVRGSEIIEVYRKLLELKEPEAIAKHYRLDAGRSEIILSGVMIMEKLTRYLEVPEWRVSQYSLREGIIIDSLQKQAEQKAEISDKESFASHSGSTALRSRMNQSVLLRSSRSFAEKLHIDPLYSESVFKLAWIAYKQFLPFHPNHAEGDEERDFERLGAASSLLEVGKILTHKGYHKHSAYLTENAPLLGVCENERKVLALLVLCQRKSQKIIKEGLLETQYPFYESLPHIKSLIACLRLGVVLCSSRSHLVSGLSVAKVEEAKLIVPADDPRFIFSNINLGYETPKDFFHIKIFLSDGGPQTPGLDTTALGGRITRERVKLSEDLSVLEQLFDAKLCFEFQL